MSPRLLPRLFTSSTIIGGLVGLVIFGAFGIFKLKESNDIFQQGLRLMAMIGFVMIAASGFANVINTTSGVKELVDALSTGAIQSKGVAAFLMLLVGLLITMGIGSSFSTVPIITSIYVPLCLSFGFSPLATVAIVGVAAALGDAGSPASDSTLGPTSGLNIRWQTRPHLGFCCTNLYSLQHPIISIRLDCSHDPLIVIIPAFIMRGFFYVYSIITQYARTKSTATDSSLSS